MRSAVLSSYNLNEVKGGTGVFVRHIRRAFPNSVNLTFSKSHDMVSGPSLKKVHLDPIRMGWAISRKIAKIHEESPFDFAICNGFAGIALKVTAPEIPAIQIFHHTYKGLANGAWKGQAVYYPAYYLMPRFEFVSAYGKTLVVVSHKIGRELKRFYGLSSHIIENAVDTTLFRTLSQSD